MLTATPDQASISTELNSTSAINVMVSGSGGFTGTVALAAAVVDSNNQPITGWTVNLDQSSLTFSADGSQMVTATLMIPSQSTTLTSNVTVTLTSSLAPVTTTTAITAAKQISFTITQNNGNCVYPAPATVTIATGTAIHWINMSTANIVVHVDTNTANVAHEDLTGTAPNGTYAQTASAPSASFGWYCHNQNQVNTNRIVVQ